MKTRLGICLAFVAVAVATMAATVASASMSITVPNYSFEQPNLGGPGGSYQPNDSIPGWNFSNPNGYDVSGVQNQGANGAYGPNTGNPIGTDQNQWAFLNLSNNGSATPTTGTITSAATLATILPSTTYELTVAVGSNTQLGGYQDAGNFLISLLANGVPVASNTLLAIDNVKGTLQDLSASFTSPLSGGIVGQSLTIQLESSSSNPFDPFGGQQSLFDNVRLTASSTPEPASFVVWGLVGACGLLAGAAAEPSSTSV